VLLGIDGSIDGSTKLGPTQAQCDQNSPNGGERRVFRGLFDLLHVRSIDAGARGKRFLRESLCDAARAQRGGEWA
jgi:hypothetical protein